MGVICGGGGGGTHELVRDDHVFALFKYKTAFLAIPFICDRCIPRGTKHMDNSVFICANNIVETPFTSDVGNNTISHCIKRF